eukprot:850239-Karenia_brevis.AAC.1
MHRLWTVIQGNLPADIALPSNISFLSSANFAFTTAFRVQLQVLQKWMQTQYAISMRKHKQCRKHENKQALLHSPWHRAAYKAIRKDYSPPIV